MKNYCVSLVILSRLSQFPAAGTNGPSGVDLLYWRAFKRQSNKQIIHIVWSRSGSSLLFSFILCDLVVCHLHCFHSYCLVLYISLYCFFLFVLRASSSDSGAARRIHPRSQQRQTVVVMNCRTQSVNAFFTRVCENPS